MTAPTRDLVIMMSVKMVRQTTNPYIVQLINGLQERVTVHTFSWRRALFGRIDVFHVHWPEAVFGRDRRWRSNVWAAVFALVLMRMRVSRVAVVRTLHNVTPHEDATYLASAVLALCARLTTTWIRLNPVTEAPSGATVHTIPHGHYRDWFARWPRAEVRPGRILVFGQVRRYKGILELLDAFREVEDADLELRVLGRPNPASFARQVEAAASGDDRVSLDLEFVSDEKLAAEIGAAEIVVLPYRRMHNSGAALLALSLDRAVLVPDGIETRGLADEVGEGWMYRFGSRSVPNVVRTKVRQSTTDDVIRGADITAALAAERSFSASWRSRPDRPDLSAREWDEGVRRHVEVYTEAKDAAGVPSRGRIRRRRHPTRR